METLISGCDWDCSLTQSEISPYLYKSPHLYIDIRFLLLKSYEHITEFELIADTVAFRTFVDVLPTRERLFSKRLIYFGATKSSFVEHGIGR